MEIEPIIFDYVYVYIKANSKTKIYNKINERQE